MVQFTYIIASAFFLLSLEAVAKSPGKEVPFTSALETHASHERGYCHISVPHKNIGLLEEVQDVCVHSVPRIYAQLGVDVDGKQFAPVHIVVVGHPKEMQRHVPKGAAIPTWSGAVAFPSHHLILLPMLRRDGSPSNDLEVTMEHEISHMAFMTASGGVHTPRWFSEGVAILQSEGSSFHRKKSIWWASLFDRIEPLSGIAKYPEGAMAAQQAYAQAADFTAYLVEQEGWNGVRYLLANLKEGKPFAAAFRKSYGTSVGKLEHEWKQQLFGGLGWVVNVTSDAVWLGLGAMICIVGFFVVRKRKIARLKEMEEEEAQLEQAIAAIDELIVGNPSEKLSGQAIAGEYDAGESRSTNGLFKRESDMPPSAKSGKKSPVVIEVDGKFHTLH